MQKASKPEYFTVPADVRRFGPCTVNGEESDNLWPTEEQNRPLAQTGSGQNSGRKKKKKGPIHGQKYAWPPDSSISPFSSLGEAKRSCAHRAFSSSAFNSSPLHFFGDSCCALYSPRLAEFLRRSLLFPFVPSWLSCHHIYKEREKGKRQKVRTETLLKPFSCKQRPPNVRISAVFRCRHRPFCSLQQGGARSKLHCSDPTWQ